MWTLIKLALTAAFGALADAFLKAFQRQQEDQNIRDRTLAEQRVANATKAAQITKDMAHAQVSAPGSRGDLIERLRREGAGEAPTAYHPL